MKYQEVCFWTEESNFEKIHNCLEKQFGLVGPMNDPADRTSKDKLVFEDSEGIGRYRVDFINEEDSRIYFRYWAQRLNSNIIEEDPMLLAVRETYKLLEPVKCDSCAGGIILRDILECP